MDPEKLQSLMYPKALNMKQDEWFRWHERLDHMPHAQMISLCEAVVLPKSFLKLHAFPLFPSCALGSAQRKPWRTKNGYLSIRKPHHTTPGSLVCVDQLISSQPGLVPQDSEYLTATIIWACNIFYDVFSYYGFGFMMRNTSLDQTIQAKRVFEAEMAKHNVTVKAYRADNERFADLGFKEEVRKCNQIITYCGVGVHGQTGNVERYIGKVTKRSRIMILHAKSFWHEAITHMLWPFAVAETINVLNYLSVDSSGKTPIHKLTATDTPIILLNQHAWGYPVYVPEIKVQSSSKGLLKWEPRAIIGVYLGRFPLHALNVALVLNPSSGHVSPQYHVVFDDNFSLIPALRTNTVPKNWADLVTRSSESVSDSAIDSSKVWFNQHFNDLHEPESGFNSTFTPSNTKHSTFLPSHLWQKKMNYLMMQQAQATRLACKVPSW